MAFAHHFSDTTLAHFIVLGHTFTFSRGTTCARGRFAGAILHEREHIHATRYTMHNVTLLNAIGRENSYVVRCTLSVREL